MCSELGGIKCDILKEYLQQIRPMRLGSTDRKVEVIKDPYKNPIVYVAADNSRGGVRAGN